MTLRTGASSSTFSNLVTGAGVLYYNFKNFTDKGTLIGATRGGFSLNPNITLRDIESDNLQGATKGFVYCDKSNPTLTVTLLEITKAQILKTIAGAIATTNDITPENIKDDSYIDNITFVAKQNDTGNNYVVVQLFNVLPSENSMQFSDNDEGTIAVTFRGHYDLGVSKENYTMPPLKIYIGEPYFETLSTPVTDITGSSKFNFIIECENGLVYMCAEDRSYIGVFNPTENNILINGVNYLANGFNESAIFTGSSLLYKGVIDGKNGKLYFVPNLSTSAKVVDTTLHTSGSISFAGTTGDNKYNNGILASNGKIYLAPFDSPNVGVIDTSDDSLDITTYVGLTDENKYTGVVEADNGLLYFAPFVSENVLILNPTLEDIKIGNEIIEAETMRDDIITGITGSTKYSSICKGIDGKLYCSPFNADNILVINPDDNTIDTTTYTITGNVSNYYSDIVSGKNGKIYVIPNYNEEIIIIDPMQKTMDITTINNLADNVYKYGGGVALNDGRIILSPYSDTNITIIE